MARHEHDREDLLRDAVAMVERIAWRDLAGRERFVGFRSTGAVSVYLDQDPAYHFNSADQLRRGYVDGQLLKAERGQLRAMRRERPGGEVQLVSRLLSASEAEALVARMRDDLTQLADQLAGDQLTLVGQVPADQPVAKRVADWLEQLLLKPLSIARSPHAK
ncbi:hypothetical protein [Aeoliella mucimassa]|uniref:Uncharacterized protein n=1 Tax=Aeoliella mucimassa TaxID=2527972 RepID=A0A518AW96_9BACT|nr:hypothetical protein [Aeoliella mucimassa]QDU58992.1 hypothetical protein Pan181_52330 [Aeoliella mucimassa]